MRFTRNAWVLTGLFVFWLGCGGGGGGGGSATTPPAVTTQPVNQSVAAGASAISARRLK